AGLVDGLDAGLVLARRQVVLRIPVNSALPVAGAGGEVAVVHVETGARAIDAVVKARPDTGAAGADRLSLGGEQLADRAAAALADGEAPGVGKLLSVGGHRLEASLVGARSQFVAGSPGQLVTPDLGLTGEVDAVHGEPHRVGPDRLRGGQAQ